jgi:GAF domain-containing protein
MSRSGGDPLKLLGKIGPVVSSTLDLETVLTTVVARATQFAAADAAVIFEHDERTEELRPRAAHNLEPELVGELRRTALGKGEGAVGRRSNTHQAIQIPDLAARRGADQGGLRGVLTRFGYRALLAIPLLREHDLIGELVICRKAPGEFPRDVLEFLMTFAAQSALAIQNARLYAETKRREWEATKLYEVSTQLASSLDADGVLDLITAETIGVWSATPRVCSPTTTPGKGSPFIGASTSIRS